MALSDVELGYALCPDAPHLGAWLANRLPAGKRAIYERMTEFGDAWNLWAEGVGEKPDMSGVIVTRDAPENPPMTSPDESAVQAARERLEPSAKHGGFSSSYDLRTILAALQAAEGRAAAAERERDELRRLLPAHRLLPFADFIEGKVGLTGDVYGIARDLRRAAALVASAGEQGGVG